MPDAPFTAVVVTHDSARELTTLLDSIDRHLRVPPQVIVVDTASSDASADVARDRAELVALDHNPGFGAASNEGVARAATDVTVLLNPDMELLDDGLARLAELAGSRRVLAVPRLLNPDRSVQRSAHPVPGRRGRCCRRWSTRARCPRRFACEPTRGGPSGRARWAGR